MTDRDGPRSNPYHPNAAQCCERCVFGTGEHAAWCFAEDLRGDDSICVDCMDAACLCDRLPAFLGRQVDHLPGNVPIVRIPLDMLRNRFDENVARTPEWRENLGNLSRIPSFGDTKA